MTREELHRLVAARLQRVAGEQMTLVAGDVDVVSTAVRALAAAHPWEVAALVLDAIDPVGYDRAGASPLAVLVELHGVTAESLAQELERERGRGA